MTQTKSYFKDLVYRVNGAAIEIHRSLGPGLLESIYHKCMVHELTLRNIRYQTELYVPIEYKGLQLSTELRADLLIEECLVVELKAVEAVLPVHQSQLLTYMKLLKVPMGLMINFNVSHLFTEGQKTFVNELYRDLED